MADLILSDLQSSSDSPFDSIRHVDEKGNEFWMARQLMPLLGYKQWRRFKDVIENAIENIETVTGSAIEHFLPVETKNIDENGNRLQGRAGVDYRLSRLACYHVALSCDSRGNNSVKAAKHYFAVKTRQAETVIPAQSEQLESLRLALEIERERNKGKQIDSSMITMHGIAAVLAIRDMSDKMIEVDRPILEVIDQRCGDRRRGMTTKQLNEWLYKKTGHKFKSGAQLAKYLESVAPELIDQVQRPVNQDWVHEDNIDAAIKILSGQTRQLLLGE